jgi:hypothetical protein
MTEIAQQLQAISRAINLLAGSVLLLTVVVALGDFDGRVARAVERLALRMK